MSCCGCLLALTRANAHSLLLRDVTKFVPFKTITCQFPVTPDLPVFKGHFPSLPILPGVLILDAMSQAACVLRCRSLSQQQQKPMIFEPQISTVTSINFRSPVVPPDTLCITVTQTTNGQEHAADDNTFLFDAVGSTLDNRVASQAQFTIRFQPSSSTSGPDSNCVFLALKGSSA
eukprot:c6329_g1_i2.p1 GENE.c6329_g1_i2~~c6329_g1_i2.p1  ORF type:complete len:175 (-),score=28.06 c6329_g1_i2:330-854(-)